jgi:GNAT superfamily N-acetyltransferase
MTLTTTICNTKNIEEIAEVFFKSRLVRTKEEAIESIQDEMKNNDDYIIVKDENGIVLWFVSGKKEGRPRHRLYELYHIVVAKEAQGKWVGKILFQAIIQHAKDFYISKWSSLRKLYLKTWEGNINAHQFYEKMWMTQSDSLRSHFANDKKELIYDIFFERN